MEPVLTLLTPADYVTTQWAGGTTTQLAIAPAGAVYAERSFLWRVSSATVELEESAFTALPGYHRLISTVRGDMTLSHNDGAEVTLHPGDVHAFDGGDETRSRGRCTDFNLMLRKGAADGDMRALRFGVGHGVFVTDARADTVLLHCVSGRCAVRCGEAVRDVSAGETLRVEHARETALTFDAAEDAAFMAAQMWTL